jgi:hypothetical protein
MFFFIPVIIGATGVVSKELKISGNNSRTTLGTFPKKYYKNVTS